MATIVSLCRSCRVLTSSIETARSAARLVDVNRFPKNNLRLYRDRRFLGLRPPASIHEVNYEETVADLEGVARRLVAACDLEWEPACREFHRTRRPIRTASLAQVRQPIYRSSVSRWKNYEHELAELFALLPLEEDQSASDQTS
jgi:hypothetical protein